MKRFIFFIALVGCLVTNQSDASAQGNSKTLLVYWNRSNGEKLLQVPYNPSTVTLRSLKKKISKMIRVRPMMQELTVSRPVMVNSFRYCEFIPLNTKWIDSPKHLQTILASPGASVTLQEGSGVRRSKSLVYV